MAATKFKLVFLELETKILYSYNNRRIMISEFRKYFCAKTSLIR